MKLYALKHRHIYTYIISLQYDYADIATIYNKYFVTENLNLFKKKRRDSLRFLLRIFHYSNDERMKPRYNGKIESPIWQNE